MKLFHEIYSCYYQAVRHILEEAGKEPLTRKRMEELVGKYGFQESALTILPKLQEGQWALLKEDEGKTCRPSVSRIPEGFYTKLQKSWIKSLLLDSRIVLFLNSEEREKLEGLLEDTEPLFDPADFYYFDRYLDGDPYDSSAYQENFQTILRALETKSPLIFAYGGKKPDGDTTVIKALPCELQYSSKDDKFRVRCLQYSHGRFCRDLVLNLARIKACHLYDIGETAGAGQISEDRHFPAGLKSESPVVIEISGERNSLERCMLHFASYEKHTEYDEEKNAYICEIYYDRADETELLIEILSFGPVIRVLGPEPFLSQVKERVGRQHRLFYQNI